MTATPTACAVALALPLVLGACSDDKATSSPTTAPVVTVIETAPASTSPATTVQATTGLSTSTSTPATTTLPSTTASVSATTIPPASVVSTVPKTSVSPEDQAMAEAVARDWMELKRRLRRAEMDPSNSIALEEALEYTAGGWTDYIRGFVGRFRELNQRILEQPVRDPTLTIESRPVAVPFTSDEVVIVTCEVDPWILVEIGTAPGGGDTVISDRVSAYRDEVLLRLVDGIWKTVQEREIESWIGAEACGA